MLFGWDETVTAAIDAPAVAAPAVAGTAVAGSAVADASCPSQADCQNWCPEAGPDRYSSEVQRGFNDNCPSHCPYTGSGARRWTATSTPMVTH
eukprot:Clim_evm4s105 gene=Clim_evmTU4s105